MLDEGDRVTVLDNCSTGSAANLEPFAGREDFTFVRGSITDVHDLDSAMQGCDTIYHLAASVGVMLIVSDPVGTIEHNIAGTEALLRVAADQPVAPKIFVASSSEVYGRSTAVPFREDGELVLGPTSKSRWSYACSKAAAEFLALAYHKSHCLPVVIGRFFNVVGPGQTGAYGMVLPRLVRQALDGDAMTVYGDGRQTRCFLHVAEAVDAVLRLTAALEQTNGGVFNIGATEEIAIGELAERVRRQINPAAEIRTVPYDEAYETGFEDLARRVPDLTRIQDAIGFAPQRGIEQIIDEVAQQIREST